MVYHTMEASGEALIAPALSTAQEEETLFAKVEGLTDKVLREKRRHLGPSYVNDPDINVEKTRNFIDEYYSLKQLADYLNSRDEGTGDLKFPLVPLQFPDELVCDSTIVCQILQDYLNKANKDFHDYNHGKLEPKQVAEEIDFNTSQSMSRDIESAEKTMDNKTCGGNCGSKCKNKSKYNQEVWILADTSYSPCCIDEVAAEHVKADIVVHFGDACLNPVDKIQSCYVFGKPYIDFGKLVQTFRTTYPAKEEKIAIMSDTPYSHVLTQLHQQLKYEYPNLVVAEVDYEKAGKKSKIIDAVSFGNEDGVAIYTANRIIRGIKQEDIYEYLETVDFEDENFMDASKFDGLTQQYSLFHLTRPHDARLLLLSTKFGSLNVVDPLDVELVHDQFPNLMKRYRNMQVARGASTVGILVNTLSLSHTRTLLNQIVKSVVEAGKKHYMFVVGKPNVAKLANFECVDCWCILGCNQSGIVIDTWGDYYKPIITPYELKLALMPQVTWTGKWVTDFEALLERGEGEEEQDNKLNKTAAKEESFEQKNGDDDDDYAPEFDPVTGKLKMNQPLRQLRHLELELETENAFKNSNGVGKQDETELVHKFSGTLSVGKTVSTSAFGLQNREWTGLGSDFAQEDSSVGALVEDGRTGVARGYTDVK